MVGGGFLKKLKVRINLAQEYFNGKKKKEITY
jgi:hypothetical protein